MMHGKERQALHLENLCTEAGTWMECQFLIPHCYENCQKATAQPQTWVSLGSKPSWILALLKGWGSHLFLHPDQHSGTRRDRCSGHIPDGHFGDSLGLLGPSSPKREVAMHMKDAQNLASWHQERGLGLQPVLPTELAARPPSLRCNHTGQVWNLHWPRCQLRERDTSWENDIECTGIHIWKWHLGSVWEIQSSPWETRSLYSFRSYRNSNIHSCPVWEKEKAPQGENWSH